MSGNGRPVGSAQGAPVLSVLLSSTASTRPSKSRSWTVVLKMIAPHVRQSNELEPAWSTVVVADETPPVTYELTLRVRLSQAGSTPDAAVVPLNASGSVYVDEPGVPNVSRSNLAEEPLPTM